MKHFSAIDDSDKKTLSLFLSLYLIILVFLIALLSTASFQGLRFDVGSKSIRDSFKIQNKTKIKTIRFKEGNNDGFLLSGENKADNLPAEGNVFMRELPLLKIIETESGKVMYADFKRADFFLNDEIYEDKKVFFKQLADNFIRRPDGIHYEIKFILGENYAGGLYPVSADSNYRQAEKIAETMAEYGVAAQDVSVGIDTLEYDKFRIIFIQTDDE